MIAQVAAATRPQALDGLVLMDTTHGPLEVDRDLAATVVLDFLGGL